MKTLLEQATEQSDNNFKFGMDFEMNQDGDRIDVSYLDENLNQQLDFMIVRTDTTVNDVVDFIEKAYYDSLMAEKEYISQSFANPVLEEY